MAYIVSYKKLITQEKTREISLLDNVNLSMIGQELATIEGVTYCYVCDGQSIPKNQPEEIASSIETVTLTPELSTLIKENSPLCKFISRQVQDKIRAVYSAEDEQYFSRIGIGVVLGHYTFQPGEQEALLRFNDFVESVRQWGRAERAKLGL